MSQLTYPTGLELMLSGIPRDMNDHALKMRIAPLMEIEYDFLILFTEGFEDIFWDTLANPNAARTKAARLVVPNTDYNTYHNPAYRLCANPDLSIRYHGQTYPLTAEIAQAPDFTNVKYDELRNTPLVLKDASEAVEDGVLGDICSVSSGNFDHDNNFETTHTWIPKHSFDKLSYYGDGFPRKFQVCLTESGFWPPQWEWMDLHESNIRGIIFQPPLVEWVYPNWTVYFVLDKPPQFYRRTEDRAQDGSTTHFSARITHPHMDMQTSLDRSEVCDVVGVPWTIQYSRVVKIEYRQRTSFDFASYESRARSRLKTDAMLVFTDLHLIEQSTRTIYDMLQALNENMTAIRQQMSPQTNHECLLAIAKLFYNCNVCPLQEEATNFRIKLFQRLNEFGEEFRRSSHTTRHIRDHPPLFQLNQPWGLHIRRNICDILKRSAEGMETSQVRALRRLHHSAASPKIPAAPAQYAANPINTTLEFLQSSLVVDTETLKSSLPEVFEVRVYPSHIQIQGPVAQGLNSVIEEHAEHIDRFIRVSFVDNNEKPFRTEAAISPEVIIHDRIMKILLNQLQLLHPINQKFEFLGYSVSGLKKRKSVWFFRDDRDGLTADSIRAGIGHWHPGDPFSGKLAQQPSKWGARLALAFTESCAVGEITREEWDRREDVGDEKFPNTDGCGLISNEFCDAINQKLERLGYKESRAFQIRFGGVKGVVYAGAQRLLDPSAGHLTQPALKMLLRDSQIKFTVPHHSVPKLRIVSTAAEPRVSLFFAPVIKALEDSGVCTAKIEGIYKKTYENLRTVSRRGLSILQDLCGVYEEDRDTGVKARYMLLRLALRLRQYDVFPEHYTNSFLKKYLVSLAERARSKNLFEIPIPGAWQALGLTDDYQVLRKNEVYVRVNGKTVDGDVLIYRDPIIHIGDIQKAVAISDDKLLARLKRNLPNRPLQLTEHYDALKRMDNVIFFSQKDHPPFPNRLSGGDLDGDRFEILTGIDKPKSWLHGFEASPPNDYIDEGAHEQLPIIKDFDIGEVGKFICQYIRNDCFSELQEIHMCLADQRRMGLKDRDVQELARWLSQAVDYAKSGVKVDLYGDVISRRRFQVKSKPDLVRGLNRKAFYDSKGEYYQSPNVLGKIYRAVSQLKYEVPIHVDNTTLQGAVERLPDYAFKDVERWKQEHYQRSDYDAKKMIKYQAQDFSRELRRQLDEYRLYLTAQNITWQSETDIFLRKKLDDFPFRQLASLTALVMEQLSSARVVTTVPGSSTEHHRYELVDVRERCAVERLYRYHFFQAWKGLSEMTAITDPRYPTMSFGQSYAFLCLYALELSELPVEDPVSSQAIALQNLSLG